MESSINNDSTAIAPTCSWQSINDVPSDLLAQILDNLSNSELGKMERVCRRFQKSAENIFDARYEALGFNVKGSVEENEEVRCQIRIGIKQALSTADALKAMFKSS